ncbi:ABC transporter ATP-binding protein [Thiohalocapsa marina]|uniref:ABC transporter ATP-binding protein n=2 Tax=Thiohalocapsa marina TaxID=424902 RepID=A0A5M8FUT6_9GAMM|nr:ABC transporter ATP-binding protein [Thiohalocapsa marina]
MVLGSLSEGIGFILLVPLLGVLGADGGVGSAGTGELADASTGGDNPLVEMLLQALSWLGLTPTIGGLLLAFLGLVGLRALIQYSRERLSVSLQHRLVDRLRLHAYAALLGVEWRWIAASRRADQANLLLTDINRVGVGLNFGIALLATAVTLLAYLATAFILSWQMSSLALASGMLVFWLLAGQRRQALALGRSLGEANRDLQGRVQESLGGIKLTKILGQEERHVCQFRQTLQRLREQQVRFSANTSLARALFQVAGAALLAAYLYLGLVFWETPVPELLTLVLIFSRLIPQLQSAQQQFHHWLHALPALEETERLLGECSAAAEPPAGPPGPAWPVRKAIELDAVRLTYAERDRPALDGVSLRFPARTSTAIIGTSGAGKSTLADVLMGLLEPDEGHLGVDGETVTGQRRRAWRRSVAYVPQEVFLFNDSIRANLLWGRPDADESELCQALQRAAADFVFDLPQGLETRVGDGGVRLSGGERQRLALARALLKQPSLLILDEATSALDQENEARVREAIEHLHGDLTVVLIGHRLATLEHADQVVVLEAGRVAARGSWAQVRATLPGSADNIAHDAS